MVTFFWGVGAILSLTGCQSATLIFSGGLYKNSRYRLARQFLQKIATGPYFTVICSALLVQLVQWPLTLLTVLWLILRGVALAEQPHSRHLCPAATLSAIFFYS